MHWQLFTSNYVSTQSVKMSLYVRKSRFMSISLPFYPHICTCLCLCGNMSTTRCVAWILRVSVRIRRRLANDRIAKKMIANHAEERFFLIELLFADRRTAIRRDTKWREVVTLICWAFGHNWTYFLLLVVVIEITQMESNRETYLYLYLCTE